MSRRSTPPRGTKRNFQGTNVLVRALTTEEHPQKMRLWLKNNTTATLAAFFSTISVDVLTRERQRSAPSQRRGGRGELRVPQDLRR